MSSSKHLRIAILAVVIVVTVGGLLLVWPSYREAKALNHQAALLRTKGEGYSIQIEVIDRLTADLDEVTRRVETEHKVIHKRLLAPAIRCSDQRRPAMHSMTIQHCPH